MNKIAFLTGYLEKSAFKMAFTKPRARAKAVSNFFAKYPANTKQVTGWSDDVYEKMIRGGIADIPKDVPLFSKPRTMGTRKSNPDAISIMSPPKKDAPNRFAGFVSPEEKMRIDLHKAENAREIARGGRPTIRMVPSKDGLPRKTDAQYWKGIIEQIRDVNRKRKGKHTIKLRPIPPTG